MVLDARLLLELPREANREMIQDAYRQRAWELHPDVCLLPDAAQRFCDLKEAFRMLDSQNAGAGKDSVAAPWSDPKALVRYVHSHPEYAARACALRRLVTINGLLALPQLFEAFDSDQAQLVWVAVHGFGRLGVRSSFPRIRAAFPHLAVEQRWAVLRFLPVLSQGLDAVVLGAGLHDPDAAIAAYCRSRLIRNAEREAAHALS